MAVASPQIDKPLVRRLIDSQFPQWARLPLRPVASAGTDHALYRLGSDKIVRLPRVDWAIPQVAKEHRWLAHLAPHLPLAIPEPLALGEPDRGYAWPWSVYRWFEGQNAYDDPITDLGTAATALARFITALHKIPTSGGPPAGEHNFHRGVPLHQRDPLVRAAIDTLGSRIDRSAVIEAWETALAAPDNQKPPVWTHGDLHAGNLLVRNDHITAVLDFGGLGVGDPACDLLPAWNLFSGESRQRFRSELNIDDATWTRGRGWALAIALIALPYYEGNNQLIVENSHRVIFETLGN